MTGQDDGPDPGARIHRAAHDPEFPTKRERALEAIRSAVGACAAHHGFVAKPQSWVRDGRFGRAAVLVFPNRFGFEAEIRLSFIALEDEPGDISSRARDLTLAAFGGPEAVIYLDVLEKPECLASVTEALGSHALPWLIAQLDRSPQD
ncbi:MAG: hypothetical protein ACK4RN_18250 [Pseudorhodobacter sp.]